MNIEQMTRPADGERQVEEKPGDVWRMVFPFAVALCFCGITARMTLASWWYEYTLADSYYSHALLVPALCAAMMWRIRDRLRRIKPERSLIALVVLGFFTLMQIDAEHREIEIVNSWTFIAMIWSAIWFAAGGRFIRTAWFPLLFLTAMAPLPGPLLNDATHGLQQLSTAGAAWMLNHIGFDNVRNGYEIRLADYTLFVDVPCSGFKTLLALLTFDAFFANMLDGSLSRRLAIFAASVPLALTVNIARIFLIAIVGECLSDAGAHAFHDYSGIITLIFGFSILFGLARIFGCRKFAGLALF